MIKISEIYDDVALDNVSTSENGNLSYSRFNRLSKRAELRMLDFLTGDIKNEESPIPYTSQKDKDWLSLYIKKLPIQVVNGVIQLPSDFYGYENMYLLGEYNKEDEECDEEKIDDGVVCNIPIDLMDGSKYTERCRTYVEGLQPSFTKPIAKAVGNTFEFNPYDLGSIALEYYAYPSYAKIVTKMDTVRNEEIVDETLSINYQYPEFARELLVYFISDFFAIHTRENALKQQVQITGKLIRDAITR